MVHDYSMNRHTLPQVNLKTEATKFYTIYGEPRGDQLYLQNTSSKTESLRNKVYNAMRYASLYTIFHFISIVDHGSNVKKVSSILRLHHIISNTWNRKHA